MHLHDCRRAKPQPKNWPRFINTWTPVPIVLEILQLLGGLPSALPNGLPNTFPSQSSRSASGATHDRPRVVARGRASPRFALGRLLVLAAAIMTTALAYGSAVIGPIVWSRPIAGLHWSTTSDAGVSLWLLFGKVWLVVGPVCGLICSVALWLERSWAKRLLVFCWVASLPTGFMIPIVICVGYLSARSARLGPKIPVRRSSAASGL